MRVGAVAKWEVRPVGEVFDVVGGGTPSKRSAAYYDGSIPWATIRDMHSEQLSSTEHSITAAGLKSSSAKLIPAGEVIMASRVGLGKACILNQATAINQDIRALIPKRAEVVERKFCLYWLQSISDQLVSAGSGATVQGIKLPFIKALPFPSIPCEEQKRIVALLDQAFAALSRARAHAEANLADATEIFDAKLHNIFYKDLAKSNKCLLPDVCTHFGRGKSRHRPRNDPNLYGGDIPFIQTGDISNAEHFIESYSQTYSELGLAQSRLWPKGTICIAIVGATIGETGILGFDACFPDSVIGLRPNPESCDSQYVEFMLQAFKDNLKEAGKGSARDNINLETFQTQRFPIPALSSQIKIVEKLLHAQEATRKLRRAYGHKCQEIANLRQSLLQKAFSGELT